MHSEGCGLNVWNAEAAAAAVATDGGDASACGSGLAYRPAGQRHAAYTTLRVPHWMSQKTKATVKIHRKRDRGPFPPIHTRKEQSNFATR